MLPVPSAAIDSGDMVRALFVAVAHVQVAVPEEPFLDNDDVPDPELSEEDLFNLVSFAMQVAAPRPDPRTARTDAGAQHFEDLGCVACHVPELQGPRGPLPAYTDILLHDMGERLADGIVMGLSPKSQSSAPSRSGASGQSLRISTMAARIRSTRQSACTVVRGPPHVTRTPHSTRQTRTR